MRKTIQGVSKLPLDGLTPFEKDNYKDNCRDNYRHRSAAQGKSDSASRHRCFLELRERRVVRAAALVPCCVNSRSFARLPCRRTTRQSESTCRSSRGPE